MELRNGSLCSSTFYTKTIEDIKSTKTMAKGKSNTGIPGLSFSWKRALGITQAKQKIARQTGIPTTKAGIERKIGKMILKSIFGK